MSFWELLALAGTMATIFGIFTTIYAVINGRSTRKILSRIEQGQTEARREMAEAIKFLGQLIKAP